VQIWNATTGEKLVTCTLEPPLLGELPLTGVWDVGGKRVIWSADGKHVLAFVGSRGKKLALGYSTKEVFFNAIWDALAGKRISPFGGMADSASDMAWSPDGKSFETVNYDVKIGNKVTEYPVESYPFALAWSPDGKRVAVTSYTGGHYWVPTYGSLSVFNASSGERLAQYDQGRFDIRVKGMGQMDWSPNGKYLLVLNGQIDIWRMESL
jgi:WD40 repeat protein